VGTYGRVLGEFGAAASQARRKYGRFLRAGLEEPPASPFAGAVGGLLLGSAACIDRMRPLLDEKPDDLDVPDLGRMHSRPSLEAIRLAAAGHFEVDPADWGPGHRSNDAARAVAAYLARRRFG